MRQFNKAFVQKIAAGFCLLGLATADATSRAGEDARATTHSLASSSNVGRNALDRYKNKRVLVKLLPTTQAKDQEYVGVCVDEDNVSITLHINNNDFRFFYSEILYVETL